jgi:hypothetical protein
MKAYPKNAEETEAAVRDLAEHRVKRSPWARKLKIKKAKLKMEPRPRAEFQPESKPWEAQRSPVWDDFNSDRRD